MRSMVAAIAASLALALPALTQPAAAPLPVKAFFEKPVLGVAALSPDGRHFAVVRRNGSGQDVVVYDQQTKESRSIYALKGEDFRFEWLRWKGEDRLLVGVSRGFASNIGGLVVALNYGRFIISVDRAGARPVVLFREDAASAKRTGTEAALLDVLKDDRDHILAIAPSPDGVLSVWKADVRTGAATIVEKGDSSTLNWDVDSASNVVVRYRATSRSVSIEGRAPGEAAWSEIVRLRKKDFKELPEFEILGSAPKPGEFYVFVVPKSPAEGETRTLRIYDLARRSLSEPIWPALKYEPVSILKRSADNQLIGVCYVADVRMCDFKDRKLTVAFRSLVKFFNGDSNVSLLDISADDRWLLLEVTGPTEPSAYYIYDLEKRHVEALGRRFPHLTEQNLAKAEPYVFKARDGTPIPGYLTRPSAPAGRGAPLVVMPHGGPEMRDALGYDIYAQYLASRGYLVFQPNFRGSAGYGLSYAQAGHRQWGARMQDDITDGVRSLIAAGQADPGRICIVGASYGGYAALIGGATTPELYKCVVSIAGVSDLVAFMKWERKESGDFEDPRYQHWLRLVGDPKADRERLVGVSPLTYAANYAPPVLLVHGDSDVSVPIEQSKKMEAALRKAGKSVRLVIHKGEDHSGWSDEHEQATLTQIADFLDKHIGGARPAQAG